MSQVHAVTLENFDEIIEKHPRVVLDFWAGWCGPCQTFKPVYEEMARHHPEIFFGAVDTEAARDLSAAFQIRSIPTLLAFREGELVFEQSGLLPPPVLRQMLELLA